MRREGATGLVSVGYGGRRLSALVELLTTQSVDVLLDVRLKPVSAIPGFSGASLRRSLGAVGIEYRHAVELGNPPENRAPFRDGPVETGRKTFRRILKEGAARGRLTDLALELTERRVAVLCAERDHERCHRQVIIEELLALRPGLALTVLG